MAVVTAMQCNIDLTVLALMNLIQQYSVMLAVHAVLTPTLGSDISVVPVIPVAVVTAM